jgi:hypothetical protein
MTAIPDGLVIVHSDPLFVVVDKPGGLLSVPGRGPENQDCAVSRLKALYPDCIEQPSVHRLDQDTSGLLVMALTAEAHRALSIQFMERLVGKRYVALIDGVVAADSGIIELAFRLDPDNRPYHVYDPERGKPGVTRANSGWSRAAPVSSSCRSRAAPISSGCTPPTRRASGSPSLATGSTARAQDRGSSSCTHQPCAFVIPPPGKALSFPRRRHSDRVPFEALRFRLRPFFRKWQIQYLERARNPLRSLSNMFDQTESEE